MIVPSPLFRRSCRGLLVLAALGVSIVALPSTAASRQGVDWPRNGRIRADVLAELPDARAAHEADVEDPDAGLRFARLLLEGGEFWGARDVLLPFTHSPQASPELLETAAKLLFLTGDYDRSAGLYRRVRDARTGDAGGQVMADVNRLFVHYLQDRFDEIRAIEFPPGVLLPTVAVAERFEENPYRVEWHGEEKRSVVPFYVTDPLPVFAVEVDGVPVEVIFDTGADTLILDDEVAEALGVESVATAMGEFGGGLRAEVGFGKVDRLQIGDATLHGVPVAMLPTKRFSVAFEPYRIGGILGTAVMRQFLGTVDYENERLLLRERTRRSSEELRDELGDGLAAEIPFVLDGTHLMMARGKLDGRPVTFFVDSGLASDHVLAAPEQTLFDLGIAIPEKVVPTDGPGGGGGRWASGDFPVRRVELGPLVRTDAKGEFGSRGPSAYWSDFFIVDALLSHGFLRQQASWTIDFDTMTFLFGRPSAER